MRASRRRTTTWIAAAALLGLTACSGSAQPDPDPDPSRATATTPTDAPASLTFSVYGPEPVVEAYRQVARDFTARNPRVGVRVVSAPTHGGAVERDVTARASGTGPDLFLADRDDLPRLRRDQVLQPVDQLLGKRQVDFGDGFQRDGLEAFSADTALQCMPIDVSPMVVYLNTDLVDLSTLSVDGGPPPTARGWSFDQFALAARTASSGGVRGVHIAPDLEQVAPFIFSAGGDVVDDAARPTRTTLSQDAPAQAIDMVLGLTRDRGVTFDRATLARRSAVQQFRDGSLAMMLGYRDLTPRLRSTPGLSFDVMPIPRIGAAATVSQLTGACLSRDSEHTQQAADFLAYLVSTSAQQVMARTGYVVPSNLPALNSEAFLQPALQPASSSIFVNEIRHSRPLPTSLAWPAVQDRSRRWFDQLFYRPILGPETFLPRLRSYDRIAARLFAAATASTATPSPTPSPTPSG